MKTLVPLFWFVLTLAAAVAMLVRRLLQPEAPLWPLAVVTGLFAAFFWRHYRLSRRRNAPECLRIAVVSRASSARASPVESLARQLFRNSVAATAASFAALARREGWDMARRGEYAAVLMEQAVRHALCTELFSEAHERVLQALARELYGSWARLPAGCRRLLRQGRLLYRLASGSLVPRFTPEDGPVTLMKGEKILWIFRRVPIYALMTPPVGTGNSRACGAEGRGDDRQEDPWAYATALYTGNVVITTRYLSLQLHPGRSLRLPLERLRDVGVEDDGVILYRDTPRHPPLRCELALPYFFVQLLRLAQCRSGQQLQEPLSP